MRYKYVYGYLRLSNDDEERLDESNSIANQRLLIQQYIQSNEEFDGACIRFCADDGFSGTNYDRPEFKRMMEFIKENASCCLIVKDLSRLGRDTIDTQNYIEKVFPFLQVRFIAVNDGYDSNDSISRRKDSEAKFKNLVNGIYPQICSRNIKQVLKKQAEAGKYHGSFPPFGYQFKGEDKTSLWVDEEACLIVRFIYDRRLEKENYSEIARELNKKNIITPAEHLKKKGFAYRNNGSIPSWTGDMVKKILVNPVYTGTIVNHKTERRIIAVKSEVQIAKKDWICVPGMHEAIVSKDEFDKVQSMKIHGACHRSNKTPVNIFSGKLKCGYCKRNIRVKTGAKRNNVKGYCKTARYSGETRCYKSQIDISGMEKVVLGLVRQQAVIADDTIKRIKELNQKTDIPKMRRTLEKYEEKIQQCNIEKMKWYEQYTSGQWTKERFLKEKEKLLREISGYREKIVVLREEIGQAESRREKESGSALLSFVKYMDLEELSYQIVQELIDVIYFYDPEHIEVIWKYKDEYLENSDIVEEGMNVG